MDYEFLKDLPDKGRDYVVCLLLADHDVDAFFKAVRSGYKVDSWVLEWLLLSRHGGYINQLLKIESATFTEEAHHFLEAYLGEPIYKTWLAEFEARQEKRQQEEEAAKEQAMRESLKAQVEKEGFTSKLFFFGLYSPSMLVELYGEEKVYEEAKKHGVVWRISDALSDDFLFSKKEYPYMKATLENAQKLIEVGEFSEVYEWGAWDYCSQINELLNKENPAYFLEHQGYCAYQRLSEESKKNFTDEQWIGYYDRFHEDAWKVIPLKDRHYLVDAMTRAKRRKFLWKTVTSANFSKHSSTKKAPRLGSFFISAKWKEEALLKFR